MITEIDCTDMAPGSWRPCERLSWWPTPTIHMEATVENLGDGAAWSFAVWECGVHIGEEMMIEPDIEAAKAALMGAMKAAWGRRSA